MLKNSMDKMSEFKETDTVRLNDSIETDTVRINDSEEMDALRINDSKETNTVQINVFKEIDTTPLNDSIKMDTVRINDPKEIDTIRIKDSKEIDTVRKNDSKETVTVRINVGGVGFKCYAKTLKRFEGSLLAKLETTNEYYDDKEQEYFFDRNPLIFQHILDSYRTGSLHIPGDMCGSKFKEELEFWGLSEYLVSRCCWEALYSSEEKLQTIETLEQFYNKDSSCEESADSRNDIRKKIWRFLQEPNSSKYAKIWSVYVCVIIAMSVMILAFESVPYARTSFYSDAEFATYHRALSLMNKNTLENTTFLSTYRKRPHPLLPGLDCFCFSVLTVELALIFCFSPNRLELLKCWFHMSEVVCSIAFWFYFICERNLEKIDSNPVTIAMIVCRYLTILRLVRLFRISRHITALKIMRLTIRLSKYELSVLGLMLFILTSLFGVLMYISECLDNNTFDNIFTAMHWALITMTTVGYGHYVPSTPAGHVVASACAVCGVIMLALPIGIFASTFHSLYHHHHYVSKHIKSSQRNSSQENDNSSTNIRANGLMEGSTEKDKEVEL